MFDDSTVQAVLNSCNNAINNYNTRIANEGASPVDTTVNAVPDSQGSNPIQDLSDLIKNIAGTTASTYQELINLKASTPTTAATPAPAGTTQSNIYIMIAIVILVVVFFLIRKK